MMTRNREEVYRRSWYKRECKHDMKKRKREYHKKIRKLPINEDYGCSRQLLKNATYLEWRTVS